MGVANNNCKLILSKDLLPCIIGPSVNFGSSPSISETGIKIIFAYF